MMGAPIHNLSHRLSRRGLLQGLAGAGAFVLGFHVDARAALPAGYAPATPPAGAFIPNAYIAILPSGSGTGGGAGEVALTVHRSEMGTGIRTSLAMVLADELDADWRTVTVRQAEGDARYGDQNTDGSRSVRQYYQPLRVAGATARRMLLLAAAARWGVPVDQCRTEPGAVVDASGKRRLSYGALAAAAAAARLPVPDARQVPLKTADQWRYIGKALPVVDLDAILDGSAVYGMDVTLPGMAHAAIERPPVYGATLKSVDDAAALAVPGVLRVVRMPLAPPPSGYLPLGGVAVIATNTWAALKGREKLALEWEPGPNGGYDSDAFRAELERTVRRLGRVVRSGGDVDAALKGAARRIEADYFTPHLAHAMMEPPVAVADVRDGRAEVWTCTQNPQQARTTVAQVLGLPEAAVRVNVTLLGGGFGRKSKPDYVGEAAFLSRAVGRPVKVTWTREDDLRNDYYHAVCAQHLEGGLDDQGRVVAWLHRSAFPSIGSLFKAGVTHGSDGELGQGMVDMPYDIPHVRCENGEARAHTRIGWYRAVYNLPHAFAVGSFVDELAAAAGRDPVEHLLALLGAPRHVDLDASGVSYGNYGASLADYPIDTARFATVVREAASRSGWGTPLAADGAGAGTGDGGGPRRGRGIAVHRSFLTYVAVVAEVAVADNGAVSVPRLDIAVDCGRIIHPDRVRAQFEGAAVMGISNTLYSGLSFRNGQVEQSNYADYQVARIDAAPRTRVHIVPSDAPPGGVGEPGVPPVAAALCNALFQATGRRIRALPVDTALLKA